MYLENLVRSYLMPYRFFDKIKKPLTTEKISTSYTSFDSSLLYEEIQDKIQLNNIDINEYNKCISFPISESYIAEDGSYKFLINNRDIKEYDIEILLVAGYIYIFHKAGFTINNILFLMKDNYSLIKNNSNTTIPKSGNNVELNLRDPNYPELGVVIPRKFIMLKDGEDIFTYLVTNGYRNPLDYLYYFHPTDIYIYNEDTGFDNDINKLYTRAGFYKNISYGTKDKMIILYDGPDKDTWNSNPKTCCEDYLYYDEIKKLLMYPGVREYFLTHGDEWIWKDNLLVDEFESDGNMLHHLYNFNYDLYMKVLKDSYKVNFIVNKKDFILTQKADILTDVRKGKGDIVNDRNRYVSFTIPNHRKYMIEIFYKGQRYTGIKLVEKTQEMSTIYIHEDILCDQFNLSEIEELEYLYIVLRPQDFAEFDYQNITDNYNGVLPIGRSFFNLKYTRLYDNGYLLKEDDYELNNIPPYNLICAFPKRRFKNHLLVATGYLTRIPLIKKYRVKIKDFTPQEENDIKTTNIYNKYIYKGYFYTDYIDFRFSIYIGSRLLMEGIDYDILSPTLVRFYTPFDIYFEDRDDSTYINIKIVCDELDNENQLENLKEKIRSSWVNFIYSHPNIKAMVLKGNDPTLVKNPKLKLYNKDVFRNHIFVTKYLSSEVILTADEDAYGDKWINAIEEEFPEAISIDNGKKYVNPYFINYPDDNEEYPRFCALPETEPLNILIGEDIIAKRKLIHENLHLVGPLERNEINNIFFSKNQYKKGVDTTMILQDVKYNPNIPFDAVFDTKL